MTKKSYTPDEVEHLVAVAIDDHIRRLVGPAVTQPVLYELSELDVARVVMMSKELYQAMASQMPPSRIRPRSRRFRPPRVRADETRSRV